MADIGAVMFRSLDYSGRILPPLPAAVLKGNNTKISFALRASLGLRFSNGCTEHVEILQELLRKKRTILLSSHVIYYIGSANHSSSPFSIFQREAIVNSIIVTNSACKIAEGRERTEDWRVSHTPYTITERIVFHDGSKANVNFVFPNADTHSLFFHDNVHGLKVRGTSLGANLHLMCAIFFLLGPAVVVVVVVVVVGVVEARTSW